MKKIFSKHFAARMKLPAAAFAGASLMALCLYLAATLLLPLWIESKLKGVLANLAGTKSVRCESLRIDLFGAELGKLSVGEGEPPPLQFEACSLKYNPFSILRGRVTKVTLSGLDINVEAKDGRLALAGISFGSQPQAQGDAKKAKVDPASVLAELDSLPVSIGCVEIRNAQLEIQGTDVSLVVPFEISLAPKGAGWSSAEASIEVSPNGQRMNASFHASSEGDRIVAKVWTPKRIRLESIPFGYMMPAGSSVFGDLFVDATAVVSGPDSIVEELSVDAKLERFRLRCGQFRMSSSQDSPGLVKIRHHLGKGSMELSGFKIGGAFPFEIKSFSSVYTYKGRSSASTTGVSLAGSGDGPTFKSPVNILVESRMQEKDDGREISGSARLAGENPLLEIDLRGASLASASPAVDFLLVSSAKGLSYDVSARIPKAKAVFGANSVGVDELAVMLKSGASGGMDFDALLSGCSAKAGGASSSIPKISLEGSLKDGAASGILNFADASLSDAASGLSAENVSLRLPFKHPISADCPPGSFSVKSVKLKGAPLGSLSARLAPLGSGVSAVGEFVSAKIPGLKLSFDSVNKLEPAFSSSTRFAIPKFVIAKPVDLGTVHPSAKGVQLSGEFALEGSCQIDGRGQSGFVSAKLHDASLKAASGAWAVEGVDAAISLPRLPLLQSAPSQRIAFKRIAAGNIALGQGEALARLDSAQSVFVESFKAAWCGGTLRAQAFAVNPGSGRYETTLHCDRISIAEFLGQLGVGHAEGQGALNGAIPISIKGSEIAFQDAFLYSTPGDSGTLKLDDNGLLTAGLQEGTQEYTSLDIARESLKNFSYSWTKISMDTQGESVSIKLQLDGKPLVPMPYRVEDGVYVRDESQKLVFQGIRLDLNFNVPLSKVLGLGGDFKSLLQKGASGQ